jgi:hypothetical protein
MSQAFLRYVCALLSLATLAACDRGTPPPAAKKPSQDGIVPRTDMDGLDRLMKNH